MMKRAHSPGGASTEGPLPQEIVKAPGSVVWDNEVASQPSSDGGKRAVDKGRGDRKLLSEDGQGSSRQAKGGDVAGGNKTPQGFSGTDETWPASSRNKATHASLPPSLMMTTTKVSAPAGTAVAAADQLRLLGEETMMRGVEESRSPALLTLEELSRTAAAVRSSGLSVEEVQREMGIIYSRRKRVRQKMRKEGLEEKKKGLLQENVRLKKENSHLESALRKAFRDVAAFEQRYASAHAAMGPGWTERPPGAGPVADSQRVPGGLPHQVGPSMGYLPPPPPPPPPMYYGGSPMGFYGSPHYHHHYYPPPHSPGPMYPPARWMHPHGGPYMSEMNPYGPTNPPPHPHWAGSPIPPSGAPPFKGPLAGPGGDTHPPSQTQVQPWDSERLLQHFMGPASVVGDGPDAQLVASVPPAALQGLLREWKRTAPEAAQNLEQYLEHQRSTPRRQKDVQE